MFHVIAYTSCPDLMIMRMMHQSALLATSVTEERCEACLQAWKWVDLKFMSDSHAQTESSYTHIKIYLYDHLSTINHDNIQTSRCINGGLDG